MLSGIKPLRIEFETVEQHICPIADPKERAEHVMLVDLARNDIGRVCDFGSVQVKDLMIIERYTTSCTSCRAWRENFPLAKRPTI